MELKVTPAPNEGMYDVGITANDKVFILGTANDRNEDEYRLFLRISAESPKDAEQQVLAWVVAGKYRIINDPLWAWR